MPTDNLPQLTPRNLTEAIDFCERLAKTNFVPKDYQNKPGEILAAIQFGAEVGLGPMQALQSIAVINGRPSLWGDALLALVQKSGLLEYINETSTPDSATCEVKRKGDKIPCKVTFSQADAIKAGLAGKSGPWQQYPSRMRCMRARGFALRNKFADVLKGLISLEEAQDYDVEMTSQPMGDVQLKHDYKTGFDATAETIVADRKPADVEVVVDRQPANDPTLTEEEQALLRASAKAAGFTAKQFRVWLFENFAPIEDEGDVLASQVTRIQAALEAHAKA